jgi:RNA polymerase sigma-70 factor (ECF subfamily)
MMHAALAGDEVSYACFLRAVVPLLEGLVRAKAPWLSHQDKEDCVQDILLAIHTKRGTWDPSRPLRPWVYAIARYKVVDALRAHGRFHAQVLDGWEDLLLAPEAEDPFAWSDVRRELDGLDPTSRAVLGAVLDAQAAPVEGQEEVSPRPGAARVAIHRALLKLSLARRGA